MVPPCAGCQGITDAGLQAFSDALKSNNSVTSVDFRCMCELCVAACRTDDGGVGAKDSWYSRHFLSRFRSPRDFVPPGDADARAPGIVRVAPGGGNCFSTRSHIETLV